MKKDRTSLRDEVAKVQMVRVKGKRAEIDRIDKKGREKGNPQPLPGQLMLSWGMKSIIESRREYKRKKQGAGL